MTVFAGIFKRTVEGALPQSACDTLRQVVSRNPLDEVNVVQGRDYYFVNVDIGAYGESGCHVDQNGALSILAGEPLILRDQSDVRRGRAEDLDWLHEHWTNGNWKALKHATGVFCAAHYQPETRELSLIADKLCVRPLFYWANDQYVVFATALRIIEALDIVPKEMDVRGVTELVGFSFPLGDRTPYAGVSLLRAGEIVHFAAQGSSRECYWRWDSIEPSTRSVVELANEAYERFIRGVTRRLGDDTTTFAFLSGGLDSRAVVGALHQRGVRLHTFNFSPSGSQDQIFGSLFASRIDAIHVEAPRKEHGIQEWAQMLSDAWRKTELSAGETAERPLLGWSGDGGSVGLGHVYMNQRIVDLMREGKRDAAIDIYLRQEKANFPARFLKNGTAAALSGVLERGVREELEGLDCVDPGRGFHLFLMLNDQRRHLERHFENIDHHRLELNLPFYDSDFLSTVLSVPIDLCLDHRFYSMFLACFPKVVTSVPWQTYPGHDPCPLPVPEGLTYQWGGSARGSTRRQVSKQASELLAARDFPEKIFDKKKLRLATLVHRLGVRDLSHVIESVQIYYKYWNLSGARYVLPKVD